MSEELKECPFCGFEAVITKYNSNIVACNNPGCPNEIHDEVGLPTITIAQWNTRPLEDALQAKINELKHNLDNCKILSNVHEAERDEIKNRLYKYSNEMMEFSSINAAAMGKIIAERDALQAKLDECELALDDNRLGRAIADSKLDIAKETMKQVIDEYNYIPGNHTITPITFHQICETLEKLEA